MKTSSEQRIIESLAADGVMIAGYPARREDQTNSFYVFVDVRRDSEGKQQPPNALLKSSQLKLKENFLDIDFIIRDATSSDVEGGLRSTLLHSFPNQIRNVFVSTHNDEVVAWIVPKTLEKRPNLEDVTRIVNTFLNGTGSKLSSIKFTISEKVPTKAAIVGSLRQIAPATLDQISKHLADRSFSIPSPDWMRRNLDALRKNKLIVRRKDGYFVLTYTALSALGSGKTAASPDIRRFLALARRP